MENNSAVQLGGGIYCSDSKVNSSQSALQNNWVQGDNPLDPNSPNGNNFFCATIPPYTYCQVSGDGNYSCQIPQYTNAQPLWEGDRWQLVVIIVIPTLTFLLCIGSCIFCVVYGRKRKDGYVPMWARGLTDTESNEDLDLDSFVARKEKKKGLCG